MGEVELMLLVDVPLELAETALVSIAAHVPDHVEIGRPLVVSATADAVTVMTTVGTWWVRPGRVERLVELHSGAVESAAWSGRTELHRLIGYR